MERLVRRHYERNTLTWATLGFWEKIQLFKAWYIVSMVGDIMLIIGCTIMIFADIFLVGYAEVFIGIGSLCIWSSITKYLANTGDFYVIVRTF